MNLDQLSATLKGSKLPTTTIKGALTDLIIFVMLMQHNEYGTMPIKPAESVTIFIYCFHFLNRFVVKKTPTLLKVISWSQHAQANFMTVAQQIDRISSFPNFQSVLRLHLWVIHVFLYRTVDCIDYYAWYLLCWLNKSTIQWLFC